MLCAEGLWGEDVVRAGEAWAAIGLGIGIIIGLQGVFGGAKFWFGWILRAGARFEAWLESGIRCGPHWQGGGSEVRHSAPLGRG